MQPCSLKDLVLLLQKKIFKNVRVNLVSVSILLQLIIADLQLYDLLLGDICCRLCLLVPDWLQSDKQVDSSP